MATLQSKYPTLMDVARRTAGDQGIETQIAEIMNQVNLVLSDAYWTECNDGKSHLTTVRNGLPTPAWARLYKGYPADKSTTTQVIDGTGTIMLSSQIDTRLLKHMKDPMAWRLTEQWPIFEAMNQTWATTFFYGNASSAVDQFSGLSMRYPICKGTNPLLTSWNCIDGGGRASTNTSIWFIGWGPRTVHCIYPEDSKAGIVHQNKGENIPITDSSGNIYYATIDTYDWSSGLTVRDWRFACRVCNLDVALLASGAGNAPNIMMLMIQAYNRIRKFMSPATAPEMIPMATKWAIYANEDIITYLDLQVYSQISNRMIRYDEDTVTGQTILKFRGIPIRHCQALLSTEAQVPLATTANP